MEQAGEIPHSENAEIRPAFSTKDVSVGPGQVRVSWAEFSPTLTDEEKRTFDSAKAVIFLLGWPWKADQPVT